MKFLIVDDHALTREGTRVALSALGDEVTTLEAASAGQALAVIEKNPDIEVVLLDLGLPDTGGLSLIEELRRNQNTVPVIVVSGMEDRTHVLRALDLGASGFIPKSSPIDVMLQAVRLVLAGGTYIPEQALAARHNTQQDHNEFRQRSRDLTRRQMEILALMAHGKSNKVIASELDITEATVKAHVTDIFRILRVANRTQAVIVAGDLGIG